MGGGDFPMQQQEQLAHIEIPEEHDNDMAHNIIDGIGNVIGFWPLLIIIILAIATKFRKKIKKWIMKA